MIFHIPIEVFDTLLIILGTIIWNGHRRIWRHISRVEKQNVMILVMLRSRGFPIPDERDTETFRRANNLEGI